VSLEIPSIGVRTTLVDLGLQADGTLAVPDDFGVAGWWSGGSRPGVAGPAVIVGHVDSYRSAAVFYRLRDLAPGASVLVHRKDGSTVTFAVEGLRQFPKDRLPTAAVYGPTAVPSLRLITCGGTFDRSRHRYEDNVVAFAHLVPSAAAPAAVTGPAPAP
jgi:sortase (surface protein transpeptidase)